MNPSADQAESLHPVHGTSLKRGQISQNAQVPRLPIKTTQRMKKHTMF